MSALRVLFWVQHLVGVGHQRRSAAIARALAATGATVCYVSGGRPIDGLDLHGCEFVQLPPVRSTDMSYHTLVDRYETPIDDDFRTTRCERLLSVCCAFSPHVVVTETWPFGRGLLRFELEPLMRTVAAMRPRPLLLSSIRDIVEYRRQPEKFERMAQRVERHFDQVLVHSDPSLVPFADSFPLAARIESRIRYTGYVSERQPVLSRERCASGPVVVSAGGGFFGERLLRTAIEAYSLCAPPSQLRRQLWHVLVGPNLPAARFDALRAMASGNVIVQRNRDDFHDLLAHCSVSVSQGGYNTIVDLLALRVPALVVPYEDDSEREQAVRATALAQRGLLKMLSYHSLNPAALAQAMSVVAQGRGMPPVSFDLDGARNSARLIRQAVGEAA
jgi:predicted glycosyltransferase